MEAERVLWHAHGMTNDAGHLRFLLDLNAEMDTVVEQCLRDRLSLQDAMATLLPRLCAATGAQSAFVHTFDEDLALNTFAHPPTATPSPQVLERCGDDQRSQVVESVAGGVLLAGPLDVAGEWFGVMGAVFPDDTVSRVGQERLTQALGVASEELDNYLHTIRSAREKQRVMMALNDALKHRVLGLGLTAAFEVLAGAMDVQRLLLVCRTQEVGTTVHVMVFEDRQVTLSTMDGSMPAEQCALLRQEGMAFLQGDAALVRRLGFATAREEVLINGITHAAVVGKILVTNHAGRFNTYDRDLLAGCAAFIRQRVVDFNKEWRTLARSFSEGDVTDLLQHPDYLERFLAPREEEVAIVYVDIAGFTRLSEQVLRSPQRVADLVEGWSRRVVDLVWEHGGAFDKMVGDCVIALFGPPFYRQARGARLQRALACAQAICDVTTALPNQPGFSHLQETGLAVTLGVNLAPLFVGMFGPNDNFTGFSSGMNNTARLQSCAERNEILVMETAVGALPADHGLSFGPLRHAKVKNVAEPLQFRALA